MDESRIEWTDYMRYRAVSRALNLDRIEHLVRYSSERYVDQATGRLVAVGAHGRHVVMIAYEMESGVVRPITVHATSRQQIAARLESGRFTHE